MRNSWYKKAIVLSIIVLFLGVSITPIEARIINNKTSAKNNLHLSSPNFKEISGHFNKNINPFPDIDNNFQTKGKPFLSLPPRTNNEKEIKYYGNKWTFYPTDDTFIFIGTPYDNYGSETYIIVGCKNDELEYDVDSLLKFDVSSIPSGTKVFAKLYLYYFANDLDPSGREYGIHRVMEEWNEDTVTWANRPSHVIYSTDTSIVPDYTGVWIEYDVSDDVQAFINEEFKNHGWIISDDDKYPQSLQNSRFRSKEYGSFIPYLIIKEPATIYVDDDNTEGPWDGTQEHPFQYIQDGVDNCFLGDTIFVLEGTYYENVLIHESRINLIGENKKETSIINNGPLNVVLLIGSDVFNVTVSGFTIRTAPNYEDGYSGIVVDLYSNNNSIYGNILIDNIVGIILWDFTENNNVLNNNILNNTYMGIHLTWQSNYNIFSNNTIETSEFGIVTLYSTFNTFKQNTVSDISTVGIAILQRLYDYEINYILDNIISNCYVGINIDDGVQEIVIFRNTVSKCEYGISLQVVSYGDISENIVDKNRYGIYCADWGYYEKINVFRNNITNNKGLLSGGGIFADWGYNCEFYCNNFLNNSPNARFTTNFGNKMKWRNNYWDISRKFPYPIFGRIGFIFAVFPWVMFDWRPAKEPYDIGV